MHLLESVVQSQLFNHIIGCLVSWYKQAHLNIVYTFECKVVVFTYFSISLPTAEHSPSATQSPVLHGHSSESLETWLFSSTLQASQYPAPCLPPAQHLITSTPHRLGIKDTHRDIMSSAMSGLTISSQFPT